jgi:hypothetical protein
MCPDNETKNLRHDVKRAALPGMTGGLPQESSPQRNLFVNENH